VQEKYQVKWVFKPDESASRAESVVMIIRLLDMLLVT